MLHNRVFITTVSKLPDIPEMSSIGKDLSTTGLKATSIVLCLSLFSYFATALGESLIKEKNKKAKRELLKRSENVNLLKDADIPQLVEAPKGLLKKLTDKMDEIFSIDPSAIHNLGYYSKFEGELKSFFISEEAINLFESFEALKIAKYFVPLKAGKISEEETKKLKEYQKDIMSLLSEHSKAMQILKEHLNNFKSISTKDSNKLSNIPHLNEDIKKQFGIVGENEKKDLERKIKDVINITKDSLDKVNRAINNDKKLTGDLNKIKDDNLKNLVKESYREIGFHPTLQEGFTLLKVLAGGATFVAVCLNELFYSKYSDGVATSFSDSDNNSNKLFTYSTTGVAYLNNKTSEISAQQQNPFSSQNTADQYINFMTGFPYQPSGGRVFSSVKAALDAGVVILPAPFSQQTPSGNYTYLGDLTVLVKNNTPSYLSMLSASFTLYDNINGAAASVVTSDVSVVQSKGFYFATNNDFCYGIFPMGDKIDTNIPFSTANIRNSNCYFFLCDLRNGLKEEVSYILIGAGDPISPKPLWLISADNQTVVNLKDLNNIVFYTSTQSGTYSLSNSVYTTSPQQTSPSVSFGNTYTSADGNVTFDYSSAPSCNITVNITGPSDKLSVIANNNHIKSISKGNNWSMNFVSDQNFHSYPSKINYFTNSSQTLDILKAIQQSYSITPANVATLVKILSSL